MRPSILVCTPDSASRRFQDCLAAILATTRGIPFDLRIVDNRFSTCFSQQDEINRQIETATGPVVNMDDDVVVRGDWLPALLDLARPDVGFACCNTTDRPAIEKPLCVPWTGLCCALLNVPVWPDGLRVDTSYKKYFFDPDLCLAVWEAGLKVMVSPAAVTHNSGGAVKEMGLDRQTLYDADKALFRQTWIDTGRYAALEGLYGHTWAGKLGSRMYE